MIRYLAHNGRAWRALPADFPPWQTGYHYHARWSADGTVNHLREQARTAAGREPGPTAAIIDSRPVRAAETVARTNRSHDTPANARTAADAISPSTPIGLLLVVAVSAASVQDRQTGRALVFAARAFCRHLTMTRADSGYAGTLVDLAAALRHCAHPQARSEQQPVELRTRLRTYLQHLQIAADIALADVHQRSPTS